MSEVLLEAEGLRKRYALPRRHLFGPAERVVAVEDASLRITAGRPLGIVGESGSGKSTLARLLVALEAPEAGHVRFLGEDLNAMPPSRLRAFRRHFQMVFQDPNGSIDPRQRVGRTIAEPLHLLGRPKVHARESVAEMLRAVGLHPDDAGKYPHQFSGGQRQRIAIARALVTKPKLIVADEPLSALDMSVQAQVLNLLQDLGADRGVTLVLISHDIAVVEHLCCDVMVMYRGRVVEQGPRQAAFGEPAHPYTRMLLAALPRLSPGAVRRRPEPQGQPAPGGGCVFAPRCAFVAPRCLAEVPELREIAPRHAAACHFAEIVRRQPLA
jgi:peptide/nickel transport system ATP-binding protein